MGILIAILIGAFIGWLASLIMRTDRRHGHGPTWAVLGACLLIGLFKLVRALA